MALEKFQLMQLSMLALSQMARTMECMVSCWPTFSKTKYVKVTLILKLNFNS